MDSAKPCDACDQPSDDHNTHLSPAAWLGKDANRSGCFGSGVSLLVSQYPGPMNVLEVDVFCRVFRAQSPRGIITEQTRHQVQALVGEVLELLPQSREAEISSIGGA
jgi:hypothetical protein